MLALRMPALLIILLVLANERLETSALRASFRLPSRQQRLNHVINRYGSGRSIFSGRLRSAISRKMSDRDLTDEELEEILDEMMYSGDVDGCIRKRIKDLMNDNFLGFVEEKMEQSDDEDERIVMQEIISNVEERMKASGGSNDGTSEFERRLDKILFTPPNKRRQYIEEMKDELSPAFLEYVKAQMQQADDADIKIVMATVLQIMGDTTDSDLLGRSKALLSGADGSLGEEFEKPVASELLQLGAGDDKSAVPVGDRNDQILAGLIFSKNDILEDVLNNLQYINEEFIDWLQEKIDASTDVEERVGLSSLRDTISTVLERVREAEDEAGEDFAEEELTIDQVKQRMKEVQMGEQLEAKEKAPGAATYKQFQVKSDKRATFKSVLDRFRNLQEEVSLKEAVIANYELCDKDFMEMLQQEINDCLKQGANVEVEEYQTLLSTINNVMAEKMSTAQERLQRILAMGNPMAMGSEVATMVRKGEMDEALVLLIEANAQMARDAGAIDAADVLDGLVKRINEERDRILPDEQRLLRALFKLDDAKKREGLLYDAFKPSKITDAEGGLVDGGPPLIAPPAFIKVVKDFVTNFGNVETFQVMEKAQAIIDEAEKVATELYGKGMTTREHQEFMFNKKTVSVWDLANFEEQALMSGEEVPWRYDKYDTMNPEDVVGERVKKIGGMDEDL